MEAIVPTSKGFMLVGGNGFLAVYERTDDKREPYIETKRLNLGALRLNYAAVFPSEDRMAVITKNSRLLVVYLEPSGHSYGARTSAVQYSDHRRNLSAATDLYEGGGGMEMTGDLSTASDLPYGGHHLQQV